MSDTQEIIKQVNYVRETRTAWLTQHGVPISMEFVRFAEALGLLLESVEAALSRSAEPPKGWREGFVNCHVPVPKEAIEENRKREPIGERIRQELTEFLERNGIVSILLDTEKHNVNIQIAKLPPGIKPVLRYWGSIFIRNEEKFMELESRSPSTGCGHVCDDCSYERAKAPLPPHWTTEKV